MSEFSKQMSLPMRGWERYRVYAGCMWYVNEKES